MHRNNFFNKKSEFLTLKKILEITKGEVLGKKNLEEKIFDVATIENGTRNQISFLSSQSYLQKFQTSKVGFCLIEEKNISRAPTNMVLIIHKNPYYAYSLVAKAFYEEKKLAFKKSFLSKNLISKEAKIGKNTIIAQNAFIASNVEIGDNCYIAPGVVITQGCKIGNNTQINANAVISFSEIGKNCIIHNGAKIGQDGFGFAHDNFVNHKIIQLGMVKIGDDVEIGANSCIDRGAIEDTVIGNGVKIDNLVQIAHNVIIGNGTVIAGCSGIAGSTKIGNYVQIGGNAAISGHITISDNVKIAGFTGVIRDLNFGEIVAGIPSMPIKKWHRLNITLAKILDQKFSGKDNS
jgi:UDP-3-O-[3-hydroxymyristoyl] glucosamine N-acyltransferase